MSKNTAIIPQTRVATIKPPTSPARTPIAPPKDKPKTPPKRVIKIARNELIRDNPSDRNLFIGKNYNSSCLVTPTAPLLGGVIKTIHQY